MFSLLVYGEIVFTELKVDSIDSSIINKAKLKDKH